MLGAGGSFLVFASVGMGLIFVKTAEFEGLTICPCLFSRFGELFEDFGVFRGKVFGLPRVVFQIVESYFIFPFEDLSAHILPVARKDSLLAAFTAEFPVEVAVFWLFPACEGRNHADTIGLFGGSYSCGLAESRQHIPDG